MDYHYRPCRSVTSLYVPQAYDLPRTYQTYNESSICHVHCAIKCVAMLHHYVLYIIAFYKHQR